MHLSRVLGVAKVTARLADRNNTNLKPTFLKHQPAQIKPRAHVIGVCDRVDVRHINRRSTGRVQVTGDYVHCSQIGEGRGSLPLARGYESRSKAKIRRDKVI